ncbi:DUF3800 domain-containing protein [Candidatus Protochlamydia phocaeensis]|uniref:DUF3800 domain-containing protein n=1 Tax=Candidatus Protochlamydia phocaeensis TaxID=1414722 RepID=UPI000A8027DF|nr:DUF3800 domain-containing protein [Candidatus Protochlamydia phocaeensis]
MIKLPSVITQVVEMDKEYILYCDESEKLGLFYSNFYGGVMVGASQYEHIVKSLEDAKKNLNLLGEVKWSKVTEQYLEKYKELIKVFFSFIKVGHLKVRLMFRHNANEPILSEDDQKNSYFKLYYQFIKHAYGLEYAQLAIKPTKVRLYFDIFPENREAASKFKGYLLGLNRNAKIRSVGIYFQEEDIAEVRSHEHVLLQCLDIVLGAMHFRLNDKHKELLPGKRRRGKRTIAKEKLYKSILDEIRSIKYELRNFNIGMTTSNIPSTRWKEPYLHWSFVPYNSIFREGLRKGESKKPQLVYTNSDA